MKRITGLLAICVLLLASQSLFAGEPRTQQGDKSVFWGFRGLSELSVDNTIIGGQYNIVNRVGVFAALGLASGSESAKPHGSGSTDIESEFSLHLELGAKVYLFRNEPVALFVSPIISIANSSLEDKTSATKHVDSWTAFGVGAGAGAEWWFAKNVSLSASTYLMFSSQTDTQERGQRKDEVTRNFFGTKGSNIGSSLSVSFYF